MTDQQLIDKVCHDLAHAVKDQIVDNFKSESFYGQAWPKARYPKEGTLLLFRSGALRKDIKVSTDGDAVVISSSLPYATIHNEGGKIPITDKMRRFCWRQYFILTGKTKTPTGKVSKSKKARQAGAMAAMFKAIALTKKKYIVIPKRQYVGAHPVINESINKIAGYYLEKYAEELIKKLKK